MNSHGGGSIITFYSYKGGTGRTMTLANLAWVLASTGKRVLVIDWDLEAPGLHRYFQPFLIDPDMISTDGLIDWVCDMAARAMTPPVNTVAGQQANINDGSDKLSDRAVRLDYDFGDDGFLDFIPAGRQGPLYAERVNALDWENFYERLGGGPLLQRERIYLRNSYDYVLIDSRTGVSDTSGICTVQMPDILVACFTLNRQSIEGVAAVLDSVQAQRDKDTPAFFPVAMRVELAEKHKLEAARAAARGVFTKYLYHLRPDRQQQYWKETEILYQPYYAYEEVLAPFGDASGMDGSDTSLLSSIERLGRHVTRDLSLAMPPIPESTRQEALAKYAYGQQGDTGFKEAALRLLFKENPGVELLYATVNMKFFSWKTNYKRPWYLLRPREVTKLETLDSLVAILEADREFSQFFKLSLHLRKLLKHRHRAIMTMVWSYAFLLSLIAFGIEKYKGLLEVIFVVYSIVFTGGLVYLCVAPLLEHSPLAGKATSYRMLFTGPIERTFLAIVNVFRNKGKDIP